MVEVHCRVSREEEDRRFAERAREQRHHPAHALAQMSPERMMEYEEPFAMSAVIEVDTQKAVDMAELAARIETLWG